MLVSELERPVRTNPRELVGTGAVQFELSASPDDNPDLSFLGGFTGELGDYTYDRDTGLFYGEHNEVIRQMEPLGRNRDEYRYIKAGTNHVPHRLESWADVSIEDKRRARAEFGNLRLTDIAYALKDIRRLEEYARGDWQMLTLGATLLVNDLPVGRGVLGGVESDGGAHVHENWSDMMDEALHEAEAALTAAQKRQASRLIDEYAREHHIGEERVAHRPEDAAEAVPTAAGFQQWNLAGIPPESYGDLIRTWEEDGFRLDLHDTGRVGPHGQTKLAYRFWDGNELLFQGDDYGCPGGHAIDSDWTVGGLLFFLSLQPGDADDDFFRNYTPRQTEWAQSGRAEELGGIANRLQGE